MQTMLEVLGKRLCAENNNKINQNSGCKDNKILLVPFYDLIKKHTKQ